MFVRAEIKEADIETAEKILEQYGVDADKTSIVLQALGYALLDEDLYPESA